VLPAPLSAARRTNVALYQCMRCGFWSRTRDAVIDHLSSAHRHESPISIDDFAVWPEPSRHPAPRELRFQVASTRQARDLPGF
jgi:hypothetical protein